MTGPDPLRGASAAAWTWRSALVGGPALVFLDEPTTGFDPRARRKSWALVAGLRGSARRSCSPPTTSTRPQPLADRLAVIAGGVIVAEGTPGRPRGRPARHPDPLLPPHRGGPGRAATDLRRGRAHGRDVAVSTKDPTRDLLALTSWAAGRGAALEGLTVTRPSLEDVYLALTGDGEVPA